MSDATPPVPNEDGEPMVSVLTGELQETVNKYAGLLSLAEAIGCLEIVKIGLYHSADTEVDTED